MYTIQCTIRIKPTVNTIAIYNFSCKETNDHKHLDRELFKINGMQLNVQYTNNFMRNLNLLLDRNTLQSILMDIAIQHVAKAVYSMDLETNSSQVYACT